MAFENDRADAVSFECIKAGWKCELYAEGGQWKCGWVEGGWWVVLSCGVGDGFCVEFY
jgi:hypothetical protein